MTGPEHKHSWQFRIHTIDRLLEIMDPHDPEDADSIELFLAARSRISAQSGELPDTCGCELPDTYGCER